MPTSAQIRLHMAQDYAVTQSLQQGGDDETQPHTIDHQMLARTEAALVELTKVARLLAFEVTPILPSSGDTGEHRFTCDLRTKSTTPPKTSPKRRLFHPFFSLKSPPNRPKAPPLNSGLAKGVLRVFSPLGREGLRPGLIANSSIVKERTQSFKSSVGWKPASRKLFAFCLGLLRYSACFSFSFAKSPADTVSR